MHDAVLIDPAVGLCENRAGDQYRGDGNNMAFEHIASIAVQLLPGPPDDDKMPVGSHFFRSDGPAWADIPRRASFLGNRALAGPGFAV